jgi:hypothetical protein
MFPKCEKNQILSAKTQAYHLNPVIISMFGMFNGIIQIGSSHEGIMKRL